MTYWVDIRSASASRLHAGLRATEGLANPFVERAFRSVRMSGRRNSSIGLSPAPRHPYTQFDAEAATKPNLEQVGTAIFALAFVSWACVRWFSFLLGAQLSGWQTFALSVLLMAVFAVAGRAFSGLLQPSTDAVHTVATDKT